MCRLGAGWRGAGPLPARGVSRACLQCQQQPSPLIECPKTKPGVLELLPVATVGHQLGAGKEHGGQGLPISQSDSPLAAAWAPSMLAEHMDRALGMLIALQMQMGGEGWGALARARCSLAEPFLSTCPCPCRPLLHLLPAQRACTCGIELVSARIM